jgi:hypothetical protein
MLTFSGISQIDRGTQDADSARNKHASYMTLNGKYTATSRG